MPTFSDLPYELRMAIWDSYLDSISHQRLLFPFTHRWFRKVDPNAWKQLNVPLPPNAFPPALTFTCKESYQAVLAWIQRIHLFSIYIPGTLVQTHLRRGVISLDIPYLSELDCLNLSALHRGDRTFPTHDIVAIAVPDFVRRDLLRDVLDRFTAVEDVYLLQGRQPEWLRWCSRLGREADYGGEQDVVTPMTRVAVVGEARSLYSMFGEWEERDVRVWDGEAEAVRTESRGFEHVS